MLPDLPDSCDSLLEDVKLPTISIILLAGAIVKPSTSDRHDRMRSGAKLKPSDEGLPRAPSVW